MEWKTHVDCVEPLIKWCSDDLTVPHHQKIGANIKILNKQELSMWYKAVDSHISIPWLTSPLIVCHLLLWL